MKYFTKLTALLLALALCLGLLPVSALAVERNTAVQSEAEEETEPTVIASGKCGGTNWALTSDGVMTISGKGKTLPFDTPANVKPWMEYYDQIKKVIVENGVTGLSNFFMCDIHPTQDGSIVLPYYNLEKVAIAGTVTRIGHAAFKACRALKQVVLHDGLKTIASSAFKDCESLEAIEIPSSVEHIYMSAFSGCKSLKEIDIPKKTNYISQYVFRDCSSLERVTFRGSNTGISSYVFVRCTGLKEFGLPSLLKRINAYLFSGCTNLEKIVIPASVDTICAGAFCNCTSLKEVCYLGTPEQWEKIKIDPEKNYHLLRAASYNLPLCKISTKYANYSYTGSEVKPVVTVKTLNGVTLKKGTNYTVSYENNEDYGTATITITGIGKYSGTTTRTFQIRPAKVQDLKMDRKTTYADLSWTANPDATSYRIYKSGVLQGETTDTHYHLTGLTAKTNRTVTVKAVLKRTNAETGETETFLGMAASLKVKPIS